MRVGGNHAHKVIITLPLQIQASVYMSKGVEGRDSLLANMFEWYFNKSPWSTGISGGIHEYVDDTQSLCELWIFSLFHQC